MHSAQADRLPFSAGRFEFTVGAMLLVPVVDSETHT